MPPSGLLRPFVHTKDPLPVPNDPARAVGQAFGFGQMLGCIAVMGSRRKRDGRFVYTCECTCRTANCPGEVDIEELLLAVFSKTVSKKESVCPLTRQEHTISYPNQATTARVLPLVTYNDFLRAVRGANIRSEAEYKIALQNSRLPKGSPVDPTSYAEWSSWGDALGRPEYRSEKELLSFLLTLTDESFDLMPEVEQHRLLLRLNYLEAIRTKARELGIEEHDIFRQMSRIIAALAGTDTLPTGVERPSLGGGSAGPRKRDRVPPAGVFDPTQLSTKIEWEARQYAAGGLAIAGDILAGWLADIWNTLDKQDELFGNGITTLRRLTLKPLQKCAPVVVEQFLAEYHAVRKFKRKGRNWMQAYACWYAQNNRTWINFSAPGRGKTRTIPAIGAELDIHLTVFFAPHRTISKQRGEQFLKEVALEDPTARVHYIEDGVPEYLETGVRHYLLVNPERFQGRQGHRIVERLLALNPGFVVFDEVHQWCAKEAIDTLNVHQFVEKPRSQRLFNFVRALPATTRIGTLTGTPIRTHVEEAHTILTLLGMAGEIPTGNLSLVTALDLRAKFLSAGFRFHNNKLPRVEKYLVVFKVPDDQAMRIANEPNYLANESIRIPYALDASYRMKDCDVYQYDGETFQPTTAKRGLLKRAVNPVFYTTYVNGNDGPVEAIAQFITGTFKHKFYKCIGGSSDAELDRYLNQKDGMMIASSSFATGIDGAHLVSNTLVNLGPPFTDAANAQLLARLCRFGATHPDGTPTEVVYEIIPVASNVEYDVRRFMHMNERREFSNCLLNGRLPNMAANDGDLKEAFASLIAENKHHLALAA